MNLRAPPPSARLVATALLPEVLRVYTLALVFKPSGWRELYSVDEHYTGVCKVLMNTIQLRFPRPAHEFCPARKYVGATGGRCRYNKPMTVQNSQVIDGRAIAKGVRRRVKRAASAFAEAHGRAPSLHVVLVGADPASQVYVAAKERAAKKVGITGAVHRLADAATQAEVEALVAELAGRDDVDGILVQLPLPGGLNPESVLDKIPADKDVDGLTVENLGRLTSGRVGLRPCTPSGCIELLREAGCQLSGKRALVIGRSLLVGKPIALMLLAESATVTIAHSRTTNLEARVREADIVIAAVGRPKLIDGAWLKRGAFVIDVGINRLEDGSLVGDVDFEGALAMGAFVTPVPGGVGPMTIAMLLQNTVRAASLRQMR